MVKRPYTRVIAAGIKIFKYTKSTTDKRAAMPMMQKSLKPQSHKFAVAFKFCGYKY
jgi:hypothetical protein